jgi:hypothetical protein
MRTVLRLAVVCVIFFLIAFPRVYAAENAASQLYLPCSQGNCPSELVNAYKDRGEECVASHDEFVKDPLRNHYWTLDQEVTSQGKANERARQFVYWTLSKNAIDNHPSLRIIWNTTSGVALFLFILVSALFGLGLIVGQQSNFQMKVQVWPIVSKIFMGLLYIVFSYAIVIFLIQLSDILMKFFIENLGGNKLFNIYFTGSVSQESSYVDFVGCRDLNYKVQEAANTELLLLKVTNATYYAMGIMLILRRVLLWFLLFAAPFLALLMPFVLIRNVGWIWIGSFFQWVFYGPLFAIFIGALATIWKRGLPYAFDFSRTNTILGYIYPTGINISYGGPAQIGAQKLSALNNGNYVDTFVEYVLTLVMLWAAIFFPWWLLRIFRDYCCEGINAMKNILLSLYDQTHGGFGSKAPPSAPSQAPVSLHTSMHLPKEVQVPLHVHLETMEDVKKTRTEDISKSLNLSMNKLTDVARFETNKTTRENVTKTLDFLKQPTKAESPAERQKYMNIRTELFNRTVKQDKVARQILSSISSSALEQNTRKQELLKTVPGIASINQAVSNKTNVSPDKISSVSTSFVASVASNGGVVDAMAKRFNISIPQIQSVLSSYRSKASQFPVQILGNIIKETGLEKEKVVSVIKEISRFAVADNDTIKQIAEKENLPEAQIISIISTQTPLVIEPEKNIEQTVFIPPTVSIEDYEEVKKMWTQQYEKGEVPVSENLSSREEWLEQDIVFITNTLNELMSPDPALKAQGVDDLGYILPIFLINNLKGEELAVYLKAKLEAAKHVKEMKEMEKQITEKLKAKSKDDEELVELKKPKAQEEAKHLEMAQEMDITPTPSDTGSKPPEQAPVKPQ